jgi:hypothetical protein
MDSILAILCIVFLCVLTYGLIQGYNLSKFHKYNCHTLYIPENLDLEQAFQSVTNRNLDELKKKARMQGATREFVDKYTTEDDKKYLKSFIIQNIISDEHILLSDIKEEGEARDNVEKRDYCKRLLREGSSDVNCPSEPASLPEYSDVILPTPENTVGYEHALLKYGFMKPAEILEYMKKDQEDYEVNTYSFMIVYE